MLEKWRLTLRIRAMAHYLAAERYKKLNWKIGIPHTVISGVATLTFFTGSEFGDPADLILKIVGGCLGVVATIMNGMNIMFSFGNTSTAHEASANQFSGLLRAVEMMQTMRLDTDNPDHMAQMAKLTEDYQEIYKSCPTIGAQVMDLARKTILQEEELLKSLYEPVSSST